jgi:homoserine dehydrogenase
VRISIFGLGNVGRALLKSFGKIRGRPALVLAASGHGAYLAPRDGALDPTRILERLERRDHDEPRREGDVERLLLETRPDIHLELTPTDLETGRPAIPHIRTTLARGIAVVTSAKSHHRSVEDMRSLDELARDVPFLDHASQLAGIPATEMAVGLGCEVERLEGVLNGTTNYILKRLEEGETFENALAEALKRGYAERNFDYDLEGDDVAVKLVGLARRLMGVLLERSTIELTGDGVLGLSRGIAGITRERVQELRSRGRKLKLIGVVERRAGIVRGRVGPRVLALDDPFARIDGFQNAVRIVGRMNETPMTLFLEGPGAGADETASRVLGNLNHLVDTLRWRRDL